jgi:hypothetical protein
MIAIQEAAAFLRSIRRRMRSGELSREPLRLLRLEVTPDNILCEYLVRPPDAWDCELPPRVREENRTHQALRDALKMRELLFGAFTGVQSAKLRAYREDEDGELELVMTGTVTREDEAPPRIPSLVMRAKLCGFRFLLMDGVLKAIA